MTKMTDWEIWLACMHPPVQKYATKEYLDNPDNWGPPMPKYALMLKRLGIDELINLYLQVDSSSPSGVSWRRPLAGTTGPASKVRAGSHALYNKVTTKHKHVSSTRTYYQGKAFNKVISAHRVVLFLSEGKWPEVADHIDGNGLNNSVSNLRFSTSAKNQQNRKSGQTKGFHWSKASKKFLTRVAGVDVAYTDDILSARAEYIRAYVTKYNHLPTPY